MRKVESIHDGALDLEPFLGGRFLLVIAILPQLRQPDATQGFSGFFLFLLASNDVFVLCSVALSLFIHVPVFTQIMMNLARVLEIFMNHTRTWTVCALICGV